VASIVRTARRVPEVMIKVSGGARTLQGIGTHFDYIGRKGLPTHLWYIVGAVDMVFPQGTMFRGRHSRPILALSIRGSRRNEEYAGSGRCARGRRRNNAGLRAVFSPHK
jgi:hypothetical protein